MVRLFDTARREVVTFAPGPVVRMYVCGITPYDSTHLGHAATYLTYDLLTRRLEELGHEVRMVRNVTDVDDSILPKARELGVPYLELAESELARFHADMEALGMRPPIAEPRATETIDEIVSIVERLLDSGHAYLTHGTAYFDTSTFPRFGRLSSYSRDQMVRLARARGGNPDDPHRRDPLDFVLWQPSLADEPAWRAPFGVGRPGWHIECSAMAMQELGPTLDLHGGGTDLIFPHHECEVAQSEALTGEPFVRHWLHSAMVAYEGEKMSKSLGNLVFVSDLLKSADPRAIRLALMRHHYRSGFEWHDTDIQDGTALLRRLVAAGQRENGPPPAEFAARVRAAIDDDLDAPKALEALAELADAVLSGGSDPTAPDELRRLSKLLGINLTVPVSGFSGRSEFRT
jgi:L-cysteine:1D-myo-inositol 2-amino-2-deoxy-alpha-D-glucopyranoside ligase